MVSLKNFVDIDIKKHISQSVSGSRDTVVLFTDYGSTIGKEVLIDNIADAETKYKTNSPKTYAYLKVFFENGGVKVLVIEGISTLTMSEILALKDEYICVANATAAEDKETNYATMLSIAEALELNTNVYGINEKLLLASTAVIPLTNDIVKNFIAKYSSVDGSEMTIAAYLSQIDVYGIDTIYDYAFTKEVLKTEDITNTQYESISENNLNVNLQLAGSSRNCGGNCKDGQDIVNNFVRIVLHQTLTEQLISLLSQKIKNVSGISKIYATIVQELERYKTAGYFSTDKIWTDETLKIFKNGQYYTIIEKGTALDTGYLITILPMSSLTEQEKIEHQSPAIYIIIADQYSIRKITVKGEVI